VSGRSQVWILAHIGYPEKVCGSPSPSQHSDHNHFLSHPFQNIIRHNIACNTDSIFKHTTNKYALQSCRMWYVLRQKNIILGESGVQQVPRKHWQLAFHLACAFNHSVSILDHTASLADEWQIEKEFLGFCSGVLEVSVLLESGVMWLVPDYTVCNSTTSITTHGIRFGSAAAPLQGVWISVSCECCALSGRGVCVRLISHPEESYWVWCVWVWLQSLGNEEAQAHWGLSSHEIKTASQNNEYLWLYVPLVGLRSV
jgi:hypothetical protein